MATTRGAPAWAVVSAARIFSPLCAKSSMTRMPARVTPTL